MTNREDRGQLLLGVARGAILVCAAVLLVLLTVATVESATEDTAFLVAKGRVTYRVYCINCHGAKGKGDGTLAELLTVKPTDLTLLTKEGKGVFPADRVMSSIDGREQIRGHGMKEMPVWGDVFQTSGAEPPSEDETAEQRANRKIRELVLYLDSIQETD
jgi:mono/diheme cytochrome c family protein